MLKITVCTQIVRPAQSLQRARILCKAKNVSTIAQFNGRKLVSHVQPTRLTKINKRFMARVILIAVTNYKAMVKLYIVIYFIFILYTNVKE